MRHGRRLRDLGTEALPWHEAFVLLDQQAPDQSALMRAMHPDDWQWGTDLSPHLLARIAEFLEQYAWQNADPQRRGPAPDRIKRPGVEGKADTQVDTIETDGVSPEEMLRRVMAKNGRV